MNTQHDRVRLFTVGLLLAGALLALTSCSAPQVPTAAPPTAVPATLVPAPPTATAIPPTNTAVPLTSTPVPPIATPVPPTATSVPPSPTATKIPPTATPVPTLKEIAAKIADKMGKVMKVADGDPRRVVYVFDERHDSTLAGIEIAVMLNRLYEGYGLKHIGLEGQPAEKGPLKLDWAHTKPYYQPGQKITAREDVMVYSLKSGEIGSAEFIGLIYADAVVDGIDDAKLYGVNVTEEMNYAPSNYLLQIAFARMSSAQLSTVQALIDQNKPQQAYDYACSTDKFCSEAIARMDDQVNYLSMEETLDLFIKIEAEAQKIGLQPTAKAQANLKAMQEWAKAMSQRSDAMVANILKVSAANPGAPVAMTIGAAHTARVTELLTKAGVSLVLVRPRSMVEGGTAGLLSNEAYERKRNGQSVAPSGYLGALLEGRKKPEPTAEEVNYQMAETLKQALQHLVTIAVQERASGLTLDQVGGDLRTLMNIGSGFGLMKMTLDSVSETPDGRVTVCFTAEVFAMGVYRGCATSKKNAAAKPDVILSHYLEQTTESLRTDKPVETKPGEAIAEQICSNTEVTWGKTE